MKKKIQLTISDFYSVIFNISGSKKSSTLNVIFQYLMERLLLLKNIFEDKLYKRGIKITKGLCMYKIFAYK